MRYLFTHWNDVIKKLKGARRKLLLFDFDGTLAGLAATPGQARLHPDVRDLLGQLARRKNCRVGIISGRSLDEIRGRVGLRHIAYVGNHGLESQNGHGRWIHPQARRMEAALHALALHLRAALRDIAGVLIEDKGVTLSVHFRGVRSSRRAAVRQRVRRVLKAQRLGTDFKIQRGNHVLEIQPRLDWGKGTAVEILREGASEGTAVFYAGDDTTDEEAFRAVRARGIAVRIGARRSSLAPYYLRRQSEIKPLLERLVRL